MPIIKMLVLGFESGLCNVAILYLLPLSAFWLRFHLRLLMQMPIKTSKINRHNPQCEKANVIWKAELSWKKKKTIIGVVRA